MKYRYLLALAAILVVASAASAQTIPDLSRDQVVPGGLKRDDIANVLLPKFNELAPEHASDEIYRFALNYDVPKLVLGYKDEKTGKLGTRTYRNIPAGSNWLGTVKRKVRDGDLMKIVIMVRWLEQCGNWLPKPVEVSIWVPLAGPPTPQKVEFTTPITVNEINIVDQVFVPTAGDIDITVPPAERGRYRLTIVGREEAGHRWEYVKSFWENLLDLGRVIALPLAELIHKAPNLSINTSSQGGAGGAGGNANAESSAAASAAASASAAAAASGGGEPEPESFLMSVVSKIYGYAEILFDRPRPILAD